VQGGHARLGETLFIPMSGKVISAKICDTVFYDKEGARLNG